MIDGPRAAADTLSLSSTATLAPGVPTPAEKQEFLELYHRWTALEAVPQQLASTQQQLGKIMGVIQSRTATETRLRNAAATQQREQERLRKQFLTRLAPKGSRRYLRATAATEEAASSAEAAEESSHLLEDAKKQHQRLETLRTDLMRRQLEAQSLEAQMDAMSQKLFPRGLSYPALDRLAQEIDVRELVLRLVPLERQREKRARTALNEAETRLKRVQKILCEVLQLSIRLGIANDSRDRVLPASVSKMTKMSSPLLLRAKSELGDYYTWIAKARMRQVLVHRAPTIDLLDLTHLPGKSAHALDRTGLQKAVERNFAETQHSVSFLQNEILVSKAREKSLFTYCDELGASLRAAKARVRAARACVLEAEPSTISAKLAEYEAQFAPAPGDVDRVPTGAAAHVAAAAEAEREAAEKEANAPESETGTSISSFSLTSTMVSVPGASPESYRHALARLHHVLAQGDVNARTDHEDEDLPWHMHALGF
ncbi:hypothetical protein MCAP1_000902 [Malassezia caprae]|uniref:Uncharacterized protein n=1 Tax=Malassezia caprae TaxID=1381934 RepID=A0AAF0E4D8_9BASI|nr:hypothetical protein MCAP1_000902 [Malassezia caprae]